MSTPTRQSPGAARGTTVPAPDRTTAALQRLHEVLEQPPRPRPTGTGGSGIALGNWRWVVRQRLAALRDALAAEGTEGSEGGDAWLAARSGTVLRDRNRLLTRVGHLGPAILETDDLDATRAELRRLVADVHHHVQRRHDLAYDDVGIELGGSE